MNPSQIPEKPLYASMNGGKVEPLQDIYFFERENKEILYVDEKQAWNLLMGRVSTVGQMQERFKLIGVGDGKLFQKGVVEARAIAQDPAKGIPAAQERIRQGVQEELEACRGKIKRPRDFDKVDGRSKLPSNFNVNGF